jgi:hypothetical protein
LVAPLPPTHANVQKFFGSFFKKEHFFPCRTWRMNYAQARPFP